MKCDHCNKDLYISKCVMESSKDTTTVEAVQTLVCTNRECKIYAGNDLTNPLQVVKTIRTKVN